MQNFILQLIEVSIIVGSIILLLMILAPALNKRYAAKWKCMVWLLLGIRLLIPMNLFSTEPLIHIVLPWEEASEMRQYTVQPMITEQHANEEIAENTQPYSNEIVIASHSEMNALTGKEDALNHSAIKAMPSNLLKVLKNADLMKFIMNLLFGIWFTGVIIFSFYHIISYGIYRKNILRWSRPCEKQEWLQLADNISGQMNLKRTPDIIISKYASSPMFLGLLRPELILPEEVYTKQDISFIFHHELTHYKRKDVLYKLMLLAANAMHWFNPAVYLMFREASGDLECSCDDQVMKNVSMEERRAYTEIIFNYLFRHKINERSISTYFYGGKKSMKNRFENILTIQPKKQGKSILVLILCACLCLGNLVGFSSQEAAEVDVQQKNTPEQEATKQSEVASQPSKYISEEERFQIEKTNAGEDIPQKGEEQSKNTSNELPEEYTMEPQVIVAPLTEPPIMQLKDSLSSTLEYFEVNSGTCTWNYQDSNVENSMTGYSACGLAPLDAAGKIKYLHLNNYNKIDYAPYSMTFSVMPSCVTIREYDLSDIGNEDAEVLSEKTYEDYIGIELRKGRVYEVIAEWKEEDFGAFGFYGNAYYSFATKGKAKSKDITEAEENNSENHVWTQEEIENMEPKNAQTVTLLAHIKEVYEDENYVVISSDTDEFPGAFVVVMNPEVYAIGNISGGEWFRITMQMTDEMYGELPVCKAMEIFPDNTDIEQ